MLIPQPRGFRAVWAEFRHRTVILGLSHILSRTGFWRLIWIAIVIAGLVMAAYQSSDIIRTSLRNVTISEKTRTPTDQKVKFPAVSLCNNNPLPPEMLRFNKTTCKELSQEAMEEQEKQLLLNLAKNYNRTYRTEIPANQSSNFVFGWKWSEASKVEKYLIHFHDSFYGECVSLDPFRQNSTRVFESSYNESSVDKVWVSDKEDIKTLEFKVNINLAERPCFLHRPPTAVLAFHVGNTPAIFKDIHVISFRPYDDVNIWMKIYPVERELGCNLKTSNRSFYDSVYNTRTYQFDYSEQTCLNTWRQKMNLEHRNCFEPEIPLAFLSSSFHWRLCDGFSSVNNVSENSSCLPVCREESFDIQWGSISRLNEERIYERMGSGLPRRDTSNYARIKIYLISQNSEVIKYKMKYPLVDILGLLGGNVSLWLGFSVIACMELLELLLIFIMEICHTVAWATQILLLYLLRNRSEVVPIKF